MMENSGRSSLIKRPWTGKLDGEGQRFLRWHQCVEQFDPKTNTKPEPGSVILVGFACDEGVRRNQGRIGARSGAVHIRKAMSNMAVHSDTTHLIYDLGDIACENQNLESAQSDLKNVVESIHKMGCKSLILGGGHEISYPHFMGMNRIYKGKRIGIINIDAHFDLRIPDLEIGSTSGTAFHQIATEINDFNYLVLGIQEYSNTKALFETANNLGVQFVTANQFRPEYKNHIIAQVEDFIDKCDLIYLTVCMDVFASAFAPGVSASNYNGLSPNYLIEDVLESILVRNKVIGLDIAEVNPLLDIDERTAKLAASLLYKVFQLGWAKNQFES
jgi:formiminoglutamase